MWFQLLFLLYFMLCILTEITAKATGSKAKRDNIIEEEIEVDLKMDPIISQWPPADDTFLLPKMFSLNDEIAVAISINANKTKTFNISLVLMDNNHVNALPESIFTLIADLISKEYLIIYDNGMLHESTNNLNIFLNENEFYVKFVRRKHRSTQQNNVLDVNGLLPGESIALDHNMDNIRYVKITGDDIKVQSMAFVFA